MGKTSRGSLWASPPPTRGHDSHALPPRGPRRQGMGAGEGGGPRARAASGGRSGPRARPSRTCQPERRLAFCWQAFLFLARASKGGGLWSRPLGRMEGSACGRQGSAGRPRLPHGSCAGGQGRPASRGLRALDHASMPCVLGCVVCAARCWWFGQSVAASRGWPWGRRRSEAGGSAPRSSRRGGRADHLAAAEDGEAQASAPRTHCGKR